MTFLQPYMLWGLPVVALPILIHLVNRMRHRPLPWAAMIFLTRARRSSTKFARLRQWLILLCRMLALLFALLALARPLMGGWLGATLSGPPDTVVVLLDRSASMEVVDAVERTSKRERALAMVAEAARALGPTPRLALVENVGCEVRELPGVEALLGNPLLAPTETAADIPAMVDAALGFLASSAAGRTEIWIASDLQQSNWRPNDSVWRELAARATALPRDVRFRLLALDTPAADNVSVTIRDVHRQKRNGGPELVLVFDIAQIPVQRRTVPVTVNVNGKLEHTQVPLEAGAIRVRGTHTINESDPWGWGCIELPTDDCLADNRAFFAYGPDIGFESAIVSDDAEFAAVLAAAAAPTPEVLNHSSSIVSPAQAASLPLGDLSLLVWHAPAPDADLQARLDAFVRTGGVLLCFPHDELPDFSFADVRWTQLDSAEGDALFRVGTWDEERGPLARGASGMSLPLHHLEIGRRRRVSGDAAMVAAFEDSSALLTETVLQRGRVYCCTTLPVREWSNLGEGPVLVPMVQRMLRQGADRFARLERAVCGTWTGPARGKPVHTDGMPVVLADACVSGGVYEVGDQRIVFLRPAEEDRTEALDHARARDLFAPSEATLLSDPGPGTQSLQVELWRVAVCMALLALAGEAALTLAQPRLEGQG